MGIDQRRHGYPDGTAVRTKNNIVGMLVESPFHSKSDKYWEGDDDIDPSSRKDVVQVKFPTEDGFKTDGYGDHIMRVPRFLLTDKYGGELKKASAGIGDTVRIRRNYQGRYYFREGEGCKATYECVKFEKPEGHHGEWCWMKMPRDFYSPDRW